MAERRGRRGNADGNLHQLSRSLELTERAIAVLDAGAPEVELWPATTPCCWRCKYALSVCTCLDKKLAARS